MELHKRRVVEVGGVAPKHADGASPLKVVHEGAHCDGQEGLTSAKLPRDNKRRILGWIQVISNTPGRFTAPSRQRGCKEIIIRIRYCIIVLIVLHTGSLSGIALKSNYPVDHVKQKQNSHGILVPSKEQSPDPRH